MENEIINPPKNMFIPICITQAVAVAVILISIIIIKFFFTDTYLKLGKWYEKNILDTTTVSTAFDGERSDEV